MPTHSSSSHSSDSHSDVHSTSHSSSSRSSSDYGYGGRSYGRLISTYNRPTFTKTVSEYTRDRSTAGRIISRTRINQPIGYDEVASGSAVEHFCEKHNYIYYPYDWKYNDVLYQKGYYDENGTRYDKVVFEKDSIYSNIICKCDYCGSTTKMDWKTGETLNCPNCGGSVSVETPIDVYTQDPDYTAFYKKEKTLKNDDNNPFYKGKKYEPARNETFQRKLLLLSFFAIVCLFMFFVIKNIVSPSSTSNTRNSVSNIEIWGRTIYLKSEGNQTYSISGTASDYDKKLTWDYGEESYYEKDSRCFLWYNTDVAPNLWQYYYVGISTSYPDGCGWMEYEPTGWYIEKSPSNWVKYEGNTSNFWHLEIDPRDFKD